MKGCWRQATRFWGRVASSRVATEGVIPPPLEDSPKCPRCSLVEVCLPDEANRRTRTTVAPRPIAVPCTEALPLYV